MTDNDDIIHHAFHHYCIFQVDNLYVHFIIDELTMVKYTSDWIKSFQLKRKRGYEWNTLCGDYDGPTIGDSGVAVACSNISNTFYKI